jgi:aminopeptidase N
MGESRGRPKLKELVVEASRALARLDADRLEELALSCQALNRDLVQSDLAHGDAVDRAAMAVECKEAERDMAVFARVLEATRANLNVMNRLRELRAGRLEYREGPMEYGGPPALGWVRTESGHGNN